MWLLLAATTCFGADDLSWTFPSGFRVIAYPDDRFPLVHAALVVDTGSVDAPPERPDLAHIVEHLAFRKDVGDRSYREEVSALGCGWNGHTSRETTTYETSCPSEDEVRQIDALLSILDAQWTGLSPNDVTLETRIAEREYALRDGGLRSSTDVLLNAHYGPTHPYGHGSLPSDDTPDATLEQVSSFVAAHYDEGTAVLSLVGDVDPAALAEALTRHPKLVDPRLDADDLVVFPGGVGFVGMPLGGRWFEDPDKPGTPLTFAPGPDVTPQTGGPPARAAVEVRTTAPVDDPWVGAAWSLPGIDHRTYFQFEQVALGASAEVDDAVSPEGSGYCYLKPGRLASTLICFAQLEDPADIDVVKKHMLGAFERPWTWWLEDRVLQESTGGDTDRQMFEREAGGIEMAMEAGVHLLFTNVPAYLTPKYQHQGAFGLNDYLSNRAKWLGADSATSIVVEPLGNNDTADAVEYSPAGSSPSVLVDPRPLVGAVSPEIAARKEYALDNGMRVLEVPVRGNYGTFHLLFRHPSGFPLALDSMIDPYLQPPKKFLGREVKQRGIRTYTSPLFSHGGYYTTSQWSEWSEEMLLALRANFTDRPAAPVPADRIRRRYSSVARSWRNPGYWLEQQLATALGGPDAVYGTSIAELDAIDAMSKDDVDAYLDAKFRPDNAELVIIGPFSGASMDEAIGKRFAKWTGVGEPVKPQTFGSAFPTIEPVVWVAKRRLARRSTEVRFSCPLDFRGLSPAESDAAGDLLGALVTDAAWTSLRDQNGAAYVAYGQVIRDTAFDAPLLRVSTWVSAADVGAAVKAIPDTIRAAVGADEATLAAARRAELTGDRMSVGSLGQIRAMADWYEGTGIGLQGQDHYGELLTSIDSAKLVTALSGCSQGGFVGIVGEPEAVGPSLDAAGVAWKELDWRSAQDARIAQLPPAVARVERDWLELHP